MQFSLYSYRLTLLESGNKPLKSQKCERNERIKQPQITKIDYHLPEPNPNLATINWRSYLSTLPTKSIEKPPDDINKTHSIGYVTPLFTFLALIVFIQHCFSLRNSKRRGSISERRPSNDSATLEHTHSERIPEISIEFEEEERFYQELLVEQRRLRDEIARAQNVGSNDWAPTCTLIGHQSFCDKSGTIRDGWLAKRKCKSVGPVLQDSEETLKINAIIATKPTDEETSSYPSSYVCVN